MRADHAAIALARRSTARGLPLSAKLVLLVAGAAIFLVLPTLPAPLTPSSPALEGVSDAVRDLSATAKAQLSTFAFVALGLSGALLTAAAAIDLASQLGSRRARLAPTRAKNDYEDLSLDELKQRVRDRFRRPDVRARVLNEARATGLDERAAHEWALHEFGGDHRRWL